jgi:CBS domain-containing protein
MLKAKDVMTKDVIVIGPEATLEETIRTLVGNKISGMPVCDEGGRIIGMISERDILNFMFSGNLKSTRVREAMSREVITFSPEADLDTICLTMGEKKIRRVPIVDLGKLVGIVSRRSIIRTVLQ